MFELISTILKYIFIVIIYYFIYGIIRLIYLDISTTSYTGKKISGKYPYLKLINQREKLKFKVDESYVLDGDKTIGRTPKNEIFIQDPFLSGEHAGIAIDHGICYIFDMGSKNGTFVNDEKISKKRHELTNGDAIHLGQLNFLYVESME
ncbi:MAG: FHA domain-containing protein [Eubacteriaceae bacterium]|nr:FHA domain-containing protein [Eubacteriaceae bacterium]